MKLCPKCNIAKNLSDFSNDCTTDDGKKWQCKACDREYKQKYHKLGRKVTYANSRPEATMLTEAKGRAKRNGLRFNITIDDIVIPAYCPVFNIPLFRGEGRASNNSPSLDRKDNSLGYIKGNVFVISNKANSLKNNATIEDIESLLKYMRE